MKRRDSAVRRRDAETGGVVRMGSDWIRALAGILLISVAAGCRPAAPAGGGGPGAGGPATAVTMAPVEEREWVEHEEFTGRTAPVEYVEVRPRISGHLDEVRMAAGQMVRKGDVLFRIDPRWQRAEVEQREAELAVAQVRVESAEREARRNGQLLESKAISREEAEARETRAAEARAALLAAKAARDSARLDLDHTEIRSPIDGRVSRALVTVGNYVSGLAGAATLLTTVVSVDPVHVYADVDEATLLKFNALLREGRLPKDAAGRIPVRLQLADEDTYAHDGYVESLDNRLDPQTGSIVLRAQFANSDGRILPGLFARLSVPTGARSKVLLVDETAIGTDQAQKFVLTVTATNTTAYRPVRLGPQLEGKRVVREGLQLGDKVIVNGLAKVRPGMPVVPEDRPSAGAGAVQTASP